MSETMHAAVFKGIDLFSDTATRPTVAMKKAMLEAELGDEQRGEDPTTRKLEEMTAELLGVEAALFFPSATMANEVAIRLLCEPGDELIAAEKCHLFLSEGGGPAVHSGVMPYFIRTQTGIFSGDDLREAHRWSRGPLHPLPKCVSIENTTNMGGGLAWDLNTMRSVMGVAEELKLKTHLDGARLFNAAVKTKVAPYLIASNFDTVSICLSKGLGCPIGALLGFPKKDYEKVRRLKQLFGGALRQSGIIAAAGIYALQNNIERLAEDHYNAHLLAEKLGAEVHEVKVELNPHATNMVFFEWHGKNLTPEQFNNACIENGVRFSQVDANRFRAVTHLDVTTKDIDIVVDVIKKISKS